VSSEGSYWSAVGAAAQQRGKSPLPKMVGSIADPNARYYAAARILVEEDVSLLMALNPSTLLLLFRKMNEFKDVLVRDVEKGGIGAEFDLSPALRHEIASRYAGNAAPRRGATRADRRRRSSVGRVSGMAET